MLSRDDMHPYQLRAVDFIKDKKRAFLMLDLGLGKTVTTLTAISDLMDGFAVRKVLIIAPLRVANSVWMQEAARWEHLKHLTIRVCTGPAKQRDTVMHRAADVYVINRENVEWLVTRYGDRWPFDCVIVDESSSFKSPSARRFKALRKTLPHTSHMILLSGTPSPNGVADLWAQCYLIDGGMALGRTVTMFRQRYFEQDYNRFGYRPRDGAAKQIRDKIAPFCLSMSAADYLTVPDKITVLHKVTLPVPIMDKYRQFERDLFLEHDGIEIEAVNAAVMAGKLLQYSSGAMYTGPPGTGDYMTIHNDKIDALKDIIEDNAGENMLIAYSFKSDLERLLAAFPHARVLDKNPDTIDQWNNGKIPLLLAHHQSASHGLNLQRGGAVIVWFSLPWSLEYYLQFNARLHRQGQGRSVRIIHIVCNGTIDELVYKVLSAKDADQQALLAALKESAPPGCLPTQKR